MEEMNSRITDQMLDELITTSLHRQQIVEDISQDVMKELDSSTRRAWLRKWGRIAAFSFMYGRFDKTTTCQFLFFYDWQVKFKQNVV